MAVKIIKEGNTKEVFEGSCWYCGCEFEYEKEDLRESFYDQRERCTYHTIKCPYCNIDVCIGEKRKRN